MNFAIGLIIALGCMFGGYAAMGGHLAVIWQPWEFVIIGGSSLGIFVLANPTYVLKETGKASLEAILEKGPKPRDFLDVLGVLHALLREFRAKGKNAIEAHIETPEESEIFKAYPKVLANTELTTFICDYLRLMAMGNAKPHEIESLMDEELQTIIRDKQKPYHALTNIADGLPALGIVAAVLGVIKAMGALDQSPELLGGLIGAALVGTFAGIFMSYGFVAPLAYKVKTTREKQSRVYVIVKQTLLAFMNGAMPQIAVEHGRKTISRKDRPTIDEVERDAMTSRTDDQKAA